VTIRQLWDDRHHNTPVEELSWFQTTPATSLELIDQLGIDRHEPVIDVGGGISTLAGTLVERGYVDVTVLDVSQEALTQAAARQPATSPISFVRADVRTWEPSRSWRLWHDRAVFHFLTEPDDRTAYLRAMGGAVESGGAIIIGTFAPNGPDHCSGLPVQRYDAEALLDVVASQIALEPVMSRHDWHITPNGVEQAFTWIACRRPA
jgi:SAM-dependent methyltransferase